MASLYRPISLFINSASSSRYRNPLRSNHYPSLSFSFNRTSSASSRKPGFKIRVFTNSFQSKHFSTETEPINNEILHEFRFFRVFKDGRIEKFHTIETIPPSNDPITGVKSKDVVISTDPAISARIFLPKITDPTGKLPILFYMHGGGFSFESAFSPRFHRHLTSLSAKSNAIAVSVEYGLFPERPIPACYEDSWAALQWVASHANRNGPEKWLNDHGDFQRVFIAGDSAGGNISHTMAVRVGSIGLPGVKVEGVVLVHPYFGGTADDEMWLHMCPINSGLEDKRLKPDVEDLGRIGCERMLIFVAEKDHLRNVGRKYYEDSKKSGWKGNVEIVENKGVEHCFHIHDFDSSMALDLINKFVSFIQN